VPCGEKKRKGGGGGGGKCKVSVLVAEKQHLECDISTSFCLLESTEIWTLWSLTYLLTYLLTPWCRVLLEQLTGLQLVKKFPSFHGTRRFITALTSVRHLSLSWASPIQFIYPHPTSWRSVLILSTHTLQFLVFKKGKDIFLDYRASTSALGPTQWLLIAYWGPLTPGIKPSSREAVLSPVLLHPD